MNSETLKQRITFRRLIQGLILVCIFVMGITTIGPENDLFWQLKMGEEIWENHTFPVYDHYNLSNPGAVWTLEEWAPATIFYVFTKHLGITSLIFLKTTVVSLTFLLFFILFNKRKVNFYISFFVFLLAALVNTRGAWMVFPSVFEYLFLVLTLFVLEYWRKINWWVVVGFSLFSLIWANSHASFFLLTGIIFSYIFGSILAEKLKQRFPNYTAAGFVLNKTERKKLAIAGIVSIFAPFLTPNGYWTFLYPFRIALGRFTVYISEYQKYWQVWQWDWSDFVHSFTLILIGILVTIFIFSRKKLNPIDLFLAIFFTGLSQVAVRHVAIFALVALWLIAKYVSVWFGEYRGVFKRSLIKDILLTLFIISFIYFYKTKIAALGIGSTESGYPQAEAEFIIANHLPGNMFNHYNYGGYLIWKMSPAGYKVFIDGRLEMYEGQAGEDYLGILNAQDGYEALLEKYQINFFLVYTTDPIVGVLLSNKDWKLVEKSERYAVFIKNSDFNSAVIKKYWSETSQVELSRAHNDFVANQLNEMGLSEVKKAKGNKKIILGATDLFERAVEFKPDFVVARLNLAQAYSSLGWWNEAKAAYQAIFEIEPENPQAKEGLQTVVRLEEIRSGRIQ
jgi:hypothetical protein